MTNEPEQHEGERDLTHEQIIRIGEHRLLQRRFFSAYAVLSMAAGIDAKQGDALTALYYMREADIEPTVNNLAGQMLVKPHTTTELLNNLEKKGLIERERKRDGDERKRYIRLTEEGEVKAKALTQATYGVYETFIPVLMASLDATWRMMVEDGLEDE